MSKRNGLMVMARLIGLVRPLSGFMVLAIAMGLVGHLCASFITIFGGYAALSLLGFAVPLPLAGIFAAVVIFALLRAILRYGEQYCNHYIAFRLLAIIRDRVFAALRRLCPAKLEGRDRGDLISIITSDVELLEVFYAHTISPVAIWVIFTIIMSAFIGSFSPIQGLLALAAYVITGMVSALVTSSRAGDSGLRFRTGAGQLSAFVLDSLRGLSEIIQYGWGEKRLRVMNRMTDGLLKDQEEMTRVSGRNMALTNMFIVVFGLAMLFVSVALYMCGMVGFNGVLIPTIALFSSFGPSVSLSALGATLQNTFAAGNRILDILDERPVTEDITGCPNVVFTDAAVCDVTFSYGGETVLSGISIDFPKNSIVGITGRSGSGKSTLLKLLMRFWETGSGTVSISGSPVEKINTVNLRDMESYVTQETHLFRDSIRNNILIAKPDATDGEIEEACRKASVHDFIMTLPKGYDTDVGELGDTLSGGERQRLGLARAFLHDAPFMLLDEPTSNLDSLNEAVILKAICDGRQDRTVALVSHRKSTMRIADATYSVEDGRMS